VVVGAIFYFMDERYWEGTRSLWWTIYGELGRFGVTRGSYWRIRTRKFIRILGDFGEVHGDSGWEK
jgi:hypothetical protein